MKRKTVRSLALFVGLAAAALAASGCGQRVGTQPETQPNTEAVTETETETETTPETETEPQKLITSVDYTSKDGSVKITLPDNTWKVAQDADEMRVFQSEKIAMINIVHADTDTSMNSLNVMTTQEDLDAFLKKQYTDEDSYEIVDFISATVDNVHIYRYVVKYNAAARMWAYSVTNAVVAQDQAYVVTGSVTDDNEKLLESVKKSVESFRVLNDETLRKVTGEVITGIAQVTPQTVKTDTASDEELSSLKEYGTTATLVTSDDVNVRLKPGTDADILVLLTKNSQVIVTGETANWFKVNINGNEGYIRKDFLVYGNTTPKETESETTAKETDPYTSTTAAELGNQTTYGSATTLYASSDVNVRAEPGTDADIINGLVNGNAVTVVGETDNWFIVSVGGVTGYVSKAYLTAEKPAAPETTQPQPEDNQGNEGNNDTNTGNNGGETNPDNGTTSVSGTVVGSTVDSITVQGDDGKTYNIYYGDASVTAEEGIYDGVHVSVNLDSAQASGDGTLYATSVSGN